MRLFIRHPEDAETVAHEIWRQVGEIGAPLDVGEDELTFVTDNSVLDNALAEAHVRCDASGNVTHCVMRLSKQCIDAPDENALNTVLLEAIHLRFLSGLQLSRVMCADQIERDNIRFAGTTAAQRGFESDRILLARYLYFFVDEVVAEKYLRERYPNRAPSRLRQYEAMQEDSWARREYERWMEPLRARVAYLHYLRSRLGEILAVGNPAVRATFEERSTAYWAIVTELMPPDRAEFLSPLAERILSARTDPIEWDEAAAEEGFAWVMAVPIPGP